MATHHSPRPLPATPTLPEPAPPAASVRAGLPLDVAELMRRREDLVPELAAHLNDVGGFQALRHPLLYLVPFVPPLAALANAQFAVRQELASEKLASGDYSGYVWLHERPYRSNAFCEVAEHLTDRDYWKLAGTLYSDSENVTETWPLWQRIFDSPRGAREHLMRADERAALADLPETLTVWCGCVSEDALDGLSWTLEQPVARWFAARYSALKDRPSVVVRGTVARNAVIAHFTRRNEAEILAHRADVAERQVVARIPRKRR